jgi:adenosylcobinamide-phosphate synthase
MTLFSFMFAFMLEQLQPLDARKALVPFLQWLADYIQARFSGGRRPHAVLAWLLAVLPPVIVVAVIYYGLYRVHPLLALGWNVVVLYLCLGFRRANDFFTDILMALRMGELDRARSQIGAWRGHLADGCSSNDVARLAIEEGLLAAHRNVLGVLFWFVILPGPSGALLYRMAEFFTRHWARREDVESAAFGWVARQAFEVLDWLPARISATCFAVVGDFEDAVYCWRGQSSHWPDPSSGVLLASGAGALGVRLGMPVYESGQLTERPELGLGDDADPDFMQSTIGLIWRTLVLCLFLLALFWVASWVGT